MEKVYIELGDDIRIQWALDYGRDVYLLNKEYNLETSLKLKKGQILSGIPLDAILIST